MLDMSGSMEMWRDGQDLIIVPELKRPGPSPGSSNSAISPLKKKGLNYPMFAIN